VCLREAAADADVDVRFATEVVGFTSPTTTSTLGSSTIETIASTISPPGT
jgi:hypothetical protein